MQTQWTISYKVNGVETKATTTNKKEIITEYLRILQHSQDVTELKVMKNTKDYTRKINEFLEK